MADIKKVSIGGTQYDIRDANAIEKGYAVNDFATNCITEIPQDIKVEVSSGTLTLKSGSILTKPNGTQLQTTSDISITLTGTGKLFIMDNGNINASSLRTAGMDAVSGPTAPENPSNGRVWFDTTNLRIQVYQNGSWSGDRTFPFCIVSITNGVITSIDKVFNGFGYIGSTTFCLPGVKALLPDGRNANGTLKAINVDYQNLKIYTYPNAGNIKGLLTLKTTSIDIYGKTSNRYFDENENYFIKDGTKQSWGIVGLVEFSSNNISNLSVNAVSGLSHNYIQNALTGVNGYASNKTQTLKHINGVLTFVDG